MTMPRKPKHDDRQWCWLSSLESEGAHGPFLTRSKAIASAKEAWFTCDASEVEEVRLVK